MFVLLITQEHYAIILAYGIYNKILGRDWFSASLFVTYSERDHLGAPWFPRQLRAL